MNRFVPGLVAGVALAALIAAPASAGPRVTVRVEGQARTLLERTQVTLPDADSTVCGAGKRWTVADAIEAATGGNWDRQVFVSTILGESHTFADSDYWALWNGRDGGYRFSLTEGICDRVMAEGEEALMLVDRSPPPEFAPSRFPLGLRGLPAAVQTGSPVTVSVVVHALDGSTRPVAGATVAGGGASAVTGADGTATLTFAQAGDAVVKASSAAGVISAGERVRVTETPPPSSPTRQGDTPTLPPGAPVPVGDSLAPKASLRGLRDGRTFKRRRAPRVIRGRVTADPSGILSVRLAVSRRLGARCWAFDDETARFERHRCGGWQSWKVGDRPEFSYLLPRRLPRGRYTIRVAAIDKAGNDSVTRTRIRVR
jgi:hypothetical protein